MHSLAHAFGLVRFDPGGGLLFGMRNAKWEEVPARLISHHDAAFLFCEEMIEAARDLTKPAGRVMKPLEPVTGPIDLTRQWYLDTYVTEDMRNGSDRMTGVALGGGQYSLFSPLKCLGRGKKVSVLSLKKNDRAFQLGVELRVHNVDTRISQRETVGLTRDSRSLDFLEISIRFLRNNFLRRILGIPEKETPERLPWETDDFDPRESFELALRLAALITLENREELQEGFIFTSTGGDEKTLIGNFIKELSRYDINFGPRGGVRLKDQRKRRVAPKDCRLDGPNFLIASRASVEETGEDRPALTIGWNQGGFHIRQKVRPKGVAPFLKLTEIFMRMEREIEGRLASFDGLPPSDQIALSAEYYSVLRNEKRGSA